MLDRTTRDAISRSAFTVVTICGDDETEIQQAEALRNELTRRGIVFLVASQSGVAHWRADASLKSSYIRDVWVESESPVLWLDPDTKADLDFDVSELENVDFAVHDRSRQHGLVTTGEPDFSGSFIWFGRSNAADDLLTSWVKRCCAEPDAPDTVQLANAWAQLPTQTALRVSWLPPRVAGIAGADALRGVSLPHSRSLFQRPSNPYYVWTPDYRESSAGVWALHALCHTLNLAGFPAFLLPAPTVNPQWNTPIITQRLLDTHKALGLEPIVVYPEVVTGNPMNARSVARYVLNRPGHFTGIGMDDGPDDLLFYYYEQFIDGDRHGKDLLTLPVVDATLFRPDPSRTRDRTFVFQSRFPLEEIDFSLFPPGTELLSMANPVTLPELATLFQSARTLYSYELSSTCTMAMACGCPVIYQTEGQLTELPASFLFGDNGAAMSDEPGGLERAARTVPEVHRVVAGMEETFWEQLAVFVRKTQAAADRNRR